MVNKSHVMVLFSFILMLSTAVTAVVQAEVRATIDRNPVRVNETFELTLHMNSAPVTRPPLKGLPKELEIVRSTNFYQSSNVNGNTTVQAGWRFILRAKLEGIFTIPSFELDGKNTLAQLIKVLPPVSSTNVGNQQDAIRLTASVDHQKVYVQQQIIYTIRLYRAVQAQYASLTDPAMEGAILERLGEDKQFETEVEGVRYIVLERRYVIFPQSKGTQIISPVVFTAEVSDGEKRYSSLGRLRSRTKAISLSTEAIEIDVSGRAQGILDWWLPATSITMTEQWLPEPIVYRVGEPITWSYTVNAVGLTATQLPEVLPETVDGLKFYPDTPTSTNQISEDGLTGQRTQKIAVVPTKGGPVTIPEIKLAWWNVKKDRAEEIVIPAQSIIVLPSLTATDATRTDSNTSNTASSSAQISSQGSSNDETKSDNNNNLQPDNMTDNRDVRLWKMIAFISLLLWLISALILTIRNKNSVAKSDKKATHSLKSKTSIADVKKCCKNDSAKATKDALLKWCSSRRQLQHIHSLSALARMLNEATKGESKLAKQLTALENYLYGKELHSWEAKELSLSLNELRIFNANTAVTEKSDELPPLHLTGK
ncbi:MAG: hypothetical protein ACI9N9_001791 [Enterobacterales bacterium]